MPKVKESSLPNPNYFKKKNQRPQQQPLLLPGTLYEVPAGPALSPGQGTSPCSSLGLGSLEPHPPKQAAAWPADSKLTFLAKEEHFPVPKSSVLAARLLLTKDTRVTRAVPGTPTPPSSSGALQAWPWVPIADRHLPGCGQAINKSFKILVYLLMVVFCSSMQAFNLSMLRNILNCKPRG